MVTTYVFRVLSGRRWFIPLLLACAGLAPVACGSSATTNVVGPTATKCQVSLSNSTSEVPSAGGSGTLTVNSERDCAWSASANAAWIALGSTSGQGSAKIDYSVQPNPNGTSRKAQVVVSDQAIDVLQAAAPCKFAIDPQSAAAGAAQTDVMFSLSATSGCQWTATSAVDWIRAASPASGTGSAAVHFSVSANPAAGARAGSITIGDAQASVLQTGTSSPAPPQPPTPPSPSPPGCSVAVAPPSASVSGAGGDVQVDVTAPDGCSWVSFSTAAWIVIKSGQTGSGNGSVIVTVSPNPGAARSAIFSVGGVGITIDQAAAQPAPACTFQLTPTSSDVTAAAQDVTVSMATSCQWTVTSNALWIAVADPGPGSGSGPFRVTVAANGGPARTGTVTAGTATFTVNQAAAVTCTYGINPTSYNAVIGADAVDVNVSAGPTCAWSAMTPVTWITIASGGSGTGPGLVHLTIDPNSGPPRSATLTIANQPFVVNQQGTCTYAIKPNGWDSGKGPDNITVDVTAPAGCSWTATSPVSWATITQGATGTGNGQVKIAVDPNGGLDRAATLTIAGQPFQLTQKGKD